MTRQRVAITIMAWGLASLALVSLNAPVLLRAPVAGLFLVTGVGAGAAVALPGVTGFGRFAVVLVAGLASWLINATIAVYAGTLSTWSPTALLAMSVLQAMILCGVALVRSSKEGAEG